MNKKLDLCQRVAVATSIAALSCALWSTNASAQTALDSQSISSAEPKVLAENAMLAETNERIRTLGHNVGSSSDGVQTQGATVSFTGTQSDGRGAFTLELLSRAGSDRVRDDGGLTVINNRVVLEIATSIGEDEKSADFFNLGGVSGGTSATLTWTRYSAATNISGASVRSALRRADRARRACFDRVLPAFRGAESSEAFSRSLSQSLSSSVDLHTAMQSLNSLYPAINAYLRSRCDSPDNDAALIEANLTEAERAAYQEELFGSRALWFGGLSGTIGTKNHEFVDVAAFAAEDVDRTSWLVSGQFGAIAANGRTSGRLTLSYGREWEDADDIDICRPQTSGALLDCLAGPGGRPSSSEDFTAKAEIRAIVALGSLRLGLAPNVAYQTGDDQFTAALPIYVVPDADGNLTGGVRFGYDSEAEDEFSAGIFISVPLSTIF